MDTMKSIFNMVFPGKSPQRQQIDVENGQVRPIPKAQESYMSAHLQVQTGLPHIDPNSRPQFEAGDQLNLFRHLVGITSHPSMSLSAAGQSSGSRPAPNLGIYSRVVHNEVTSKAGYKYFSWLINSCLGLQIIVAAALTAMGAAGASRSAVTVFGAINTVIAGLLTFLKGSGLPNRLKYYNTEWKRVREFIEQRERDFGRPACDLDLYGVVDIIEHMYEEVKADLEASMPDRFAGNSSSTRRNLGQPPVETPAPGIPAISVNLPRTATLTTEGYSEKMKEYESGFSNKIKEVASEIGNKVYQAKDTVREFQEHKPYDATGDVKVYADRVERVEHGFEEKVKDLVSDIGHKAQTVRDVAQDYSEHKHREIELVGSQVENFRDRFDRAMSSLRESQQRHKSQPGMNVSRSNEQIERDNNGQHGDVTDVEKVTRT